MEKIAAERSILELSLPVLKEIYGNFEIDANQQDKPDAAIILGSEVAGKKIRVGIEITSIDKQEDLQYFNDEKIMRPVLQNQINTLLESGAYSQQPNKRSTVLINDTYMLDGLVKKEGKFESYAQSDEYKEIIILAFSDCFGISNPYFAALAEWTDYFLSQRKFIFDRVIFVSSSPEGALEIYDKSKPRINKPINLIPKDAHINAIQGPILPIGQQVKISDFFDREPLVPKTVKGKSKSKKKSPP